MMYGQLKEKHTDRIVIMTVNEIVVQGIKTLNELNEAHKGPMEQAVRACFSDLISGSWNDIRGIIKRSL